MCDLWSIDVEGKGKRTKQPSKPLCHPRLALQALLEYIGTTLFGDILIFIVVLAPCRETLALYHRPGQIPKQGNLQVS